MEKEGVTPDVLVDVPPEQFQLGADPQIAKAVEVLIQDVIAWKKNNPQLPTISSGGGGNSSAPMK